MKLLALLAVLPAIFALPKPEPEPYHPFLLSPISNSTLSANPISHGSLNSRAEIAAKAPRHNAKTHEMAKRSIRRVKRQSGGSAASCIPRGETSVSSVIPSPSSTTTQQGTTTTQQATTSPTTSSTTVTMPSTTVTQSPPQQTRYTVDPDGNGPFVGQATYYDTDVGYGSCGKWHKNWEATVAVSRELMNSWPGATANPNLHPICGQKLQINYGGKSLIAEVQDTCPSCTKRWIDVSQGVFEYFAHTDVGMLGIDGYTPGFTWQWVDINTPLTSLPH